MKRIIPVIILTMVSVCFAQRTATENYVQRKVQEHNENADAHSDIRALIGGITFTQKVESVNSQTGNVVITAESIGALMKAGANVVNDDFGITVLYSNGREQLVLDKDQLIYVSFDEDGNETYATILMGGGVIFTDFATGAMRFISVDGVVNYNNKTIYWPDFVDNEDTFAKLTDIANATNKIPTGPFDRIEMPAQAIDATGGVWRVGGTATNWVFDLSSLRYVNDGITYSPPVTTAVVPQPAIGFGAWGELGGGWRIFINGDIYTDDLKFVVFCDGGNWDNFWEQTFVGAQSFGVVPDTFTSQWRYGNTVEGTTFTCSRKVVGIMEMVDALAYKSGLTNKLDAASPYNSEGRMVWVEDIPPNASAGRLEFRDVALLFGSTWIDDTGISIIGTELTWGWMAEFRQNADNLADKTYVDAAVDAIPLHFTNGTSLADGVLNGTNGVYFTRNGTNHWILLP